MGDICKGAKVGDLQLRVGDHLQEHTAGVLVNGISHRLQVGEVTQPRLYAKTQQRVADQGECIAEEVGGCHDILPLCTHRKQGVADSRHPRVERRHMGCVRQQPYPLFEVRHGRVLHPGIVGSLDTVAESIRHQLGILKLKGNVMVYWYGERAIGIGAYIRGVNSNGLFLHLSIIIFELNIKLRRVNQSGTESVFHGFVGGVHL